MTRWDRFLCVDWGKDLAKRRAWVAELGTCSVAPADVEPRLAALVGFTRGTPLGTRGDRRGPRWPASALLVGSG